MARELGRSKIVLATSLLAWLYGCPGEDLPDTCYEQGITGDGYTFNIPFPGQDNVPVAEQEIMSVVRVPAGAVTDPTTFKLCLIKPQDLPSPEDIHGYGVEISPAGFEFKRPIEVKYFIPRSDSPEDLALLRISREAVDAHLSRWELVDGLMRGFGPPMMSGELRRTGIYAVHDRPVQVTAVDFNVGGEPVDFSGRMHVVAETLEDVPTDLDIRVTFENAGNGEGMGRVSGTLTIINLASMRTVSATMADALLTARSDGSVTIGPPDRLLVHDSTWPSQVESIELATGAEQALRIENGNTIILDFNRATEEITSALDESGFGGVAVAPFFRPHQTYRWVLRCTGSLEIAYQGISGSVIDAGGILNTSSE